MSFVARGACDSCAELMMYEYNNDDLIMDSYEYMYEYIHIHIRQLDSDK